MEEETAEDAAKFADATNKDGFRPRSSAYDEEARLAGDACSPVDRDRLSVRVVRASEPAHLTSPRQRGKGLKTGGWQDCRRREAAKGAAGESVWWRGDEEGAREQGRESEREGVRVAQPRCTAKRGWERRSRDAGGREAPGDRGGRGGVQKSAVLERNARQRRRGLASVAGGRRGQATSARGSRGSKQDFPVTGRRPSRAERRARKRDGASRRRRTVFGDRLTKTDARFATERERTARRDPTAVARQS